MSIIQQVGGSELKHELVVEKFVIDLCIYHIIRFNIPGKLWRTLISKTINPFEINIETKIPDITAIKANIKFMFRCIKCRYERIIGSLHIEQIVGIIGDECKIF